MVMKEYLKDAFLVAQKKAYESGELDRIKQNDGVYTIQMLWALKDMARNDIYPDSRFSDIDCNVWSMFR